MNMCSALLSLALTTSLITPSLAQNAVPYVHMKVCPSDAQSFCVQPEDGPVRIYPRTKPFKIDLRMGGRWVDNEFTMALSPESRLIVGGYRDYAIKYLALAEPKANAAQEFVLQVEFSWLGMMMMITYAFGEIQPQDRVVINGFSNGAGHDGDIRSFLKTFKYVIPELSIQAANRIAVNETKAEDRERIKPTTDLVKQYQFKAPSLFKP